MSGDIKILNLKITSLQKRRDVFVATRALRQNVIRHYECSPHLALPRRFKTSLTKVVK